MSAIKTNPYNQNVELGRVSWYRDYDDALALSKKQEKPILLFFQEIPGCSTCVNYGREVLSHPLMVEIIENEFIPLAIYNNKPGKDAEILKRYNEPSWNNPVTYFIDSEGKSIVNKLANNYEPFALYNKILEVFDVKHREVPLYFALLKKDIMLAYGKTKRVIYETPCFWSGETTFAQHPAVYATMPGFIGSREVVDVQYDEQLITRNELDSFALEQGFFLIEPSSSFRIDKDPQYYLKKTNYKYLPLSFAQKTIINYAIPYKENPEKYLSPKQKYWINNKLLQELSHPKAYTLPMQQSWECLYNSVK